jgi:hypothetical protein
MQPPARSFPARASFLLLGLTAALAACSIVPGASLSPKEEALRDVAERQALWLSKQVDDYSFTVTRQCFCPFTDPVDVTVADGVTTAMTKDGQPVDPLEVAGLPRTIQDVFAIVAGSADAADVVVEWDPEFGFPTSIQVDSIENAIDDEFGILVTNFRPAS